MPSIPPEPDRKLFRERLRAHLEAADLSQAALEKRIGAPKGSLTRVFGGRKALTWELLRDACEALDADPVALVAGTAFEEILPEEPPSTPEVEAPAPLPAPEERPPEEPVPPPDLEAEPPPEAEEVGPEPVSVPEHTLGGAEIPPPEHSPGGVDLAPDEGPAPEDGPRPKLKALPKKVVGAVAAGAVAAGALVATLFRRR